MMEVDSLIETVAFSLLLLRAFSGQKKRKRLEKLASLGSLTLFLSLYLVWKESLKLPLAFTLLTVKFSKWAETLRTCLFFFINANEKGDVRVPLGNCLRRTGQ